jgi:hypothetical protein
VSVEAINWALAVPVGGNAKVCLLGLANHAHPDGSHAFPTLATLAVYAHCDRSTAKRNIRRLVADGWIRSEGVGPNGAMNYTLAMPCQQGGQNAPGALEPFRGGTSAPGGVAPAHPEPSDNRQGTVKREERARAKADEVPDDFPENLRPHARIVYPLLRDVAEQHNARPVTARAVALTIMGNPGRRYVSEAHAFAAWAQAPPRPVKDVVGSYRTWLKRAEQFAGVEQLSEASPNGLPANVAPLRRRNGRSTAADYQNLKGRLG